MCEYIVVNAAIFSEVSKLERFQTAKVTSKVTQARSCMGIR